MRMKPSLSAALGSVVPLKKDWAEPPQGWSWVGVGVGRQKWWGRVQRGGTTHSDDDGRFRGRFVGNVDIHLDVGRVVAKVGHLLQRRGEHGRGQSQEVRGEAREDHGEERAVPVVQDGEPEGEEYSDDFLPKKKTPPRTR